MKKGKSDRSDACFRIVDTPVSSAWLPTTLARVAMARMPLYCAEPNTPPPATYQKTLLMTPAGPLEPPWMPIKPSPVQLGCGCGKER